MSFKNLIKARGRRRKSISDTVPEISKIRFRRTEADEKGMSSSYIVKSKTKTISQKRYDKLRENLRSGFGTDPGKFPEAQGFPTVNFPENMRHLKKKLVEPRFDQYFFEIEHVLSEIYSGEKKNFSKGTPPLYLTLRGGILPSTHGKFDFFEKIDI